MKITLAMIAKGELQNLKRLKPLVENYIDEWVVVFPPKDKAIGWAKKNGIKAVVKDFTIGIEDDVREQMYDMGIEVPEDYRIFKFAEARNESFAQATGDYILWLDADDEPIGIENLREQLSEAQGADVIAAVYDYARDEEGNQISNHVRERIIKNNGKNEWRGSKLGLIHETVVPKEGYRPKYRSIDKDIFIVRHHSDHMESSSMRNHVALLYEYIVTKGEDPRTIYYLGMEFYNRKMYDYSAKMMQEYVKVGGWWEEVYRGWITMAEAYHHLGDKESSRNAYLNAVKLAPQLPDAYLGLGESYYAEEDWKKAIEFLITGMQKKPPQTTASVDMTRYLFRPLNFLALASIQVGKSGDAWKWFERAKKMNPKHPWVQQYAELFEEMKDMEDFIRAFVTVGQLARKRYPEILPKLAESIPDSLKDQELLLAFKQMHTKPKMWPDNSVVIFAYSGFEDWGPDSLATGTGGSEEAVIHLSRRLVKMGWDVTVFNNCPEEKDVDGVKWRRYESFNPRDAFGIVIGWRSNIFMDSVVADKKFIDLHDVPYGDSFPPDSVADVKLLVKSDYHRSLFTHLEDDNFTIIPNGVDSEQFANKPDKVKNNLVWTSSYDRGLEYLLDMWADIKKEVPDASLDVYYGFNLIDGSPHMQPKEYRAWRDKMTTLLEQDGITHHGRVGTDEIAQAYLKADIWAYPTAFAEISCITAMKAQIAGAIPVSTDYAALKETIKEGVVIEGSAIDEDVRQKFKEELISLMKDDKRKEAIRSKLGQHDFSWDSVAKAWDEAFRG